MLKDLNSGQKRKYIKLNSQIKRLQRGDTKMLAHASDQKSRQGSLSPHSINEK